MADALILLSSVIVGLLLLRSLGGEGLNIKFQLAPISTTKGKRDHIIVWVALSMMFLGITYYFVRQSETNVISLLVVPFILGALVTMLLRIKSKK